MRTGFVACGMALFAGLCASVQAQEIKDAASLDPAYFMAGVVTGCVTPRQLPRCYVGYRSSGQQRQAEMFLFMAQVWVKNKHPDEPLTHYQTPGGEQFIIDHWPLATALQNFFLTPRVDPTAPPTFNMREVAVAEPTERCSFLAGFYAAHHVKDRDVFNAAASYAIRDVMYLLLSEGCEVSKVRVSDGVPATMEFKVKPTEEVARIFALVDGWQPEAAEWKPR